MFTNTHSINVSVVRGATNPARRIGKSVYPLTDKENRAIARNSMKEAFAQSSDANGFITVSGIRDAMESTICINVSAALADSFDLATAAACVHAAFATRNRSIPAAANTTACRSNSKRRRKRERFDAFGVVDALIFVSMYFDRIRRAASNRVGYRLRRGPRPANMGARSAHQHILGDFNPLDYLC
ncbi:uncharacterized protein AMSG_06847 [Thecamonas trahens ATCC 50062]|uniref:Uncharacterized protein n=1 Tax=Thecamonas trahens ATCC 50062 TaxID=461836 RepID=A0A0L0DDR1_THETB|nr:hypothetical protein AMSG_06847 [Thecamonas trahens ATCC 50062]KNC50360.1 hypothetical protein AMSG_06847 [Thecamonas trahens ATCC 50062]|eukprot:XP_013756902.1 hypothetical protein AMSG_06847 [Thecamonas trahens ATCC 50062]